LVAGTELANFNISRKFGPCNFFVTTALNRGSGLSSLSTCIASAFALAIAALISSTLRAVGKAQTSLALLSLLQRCSVAVKKLIVKD
jgi:hypothetical protein